MDSKLFHHGILGMHWGIRRYQPYPNGKVPPNAKEIGEAAKKASQQNIHRDYSHGVNMKEGSKNYKLNAYEYLGGDKSKLDAKKLTTFTLKTNDENNKYILKKGSAVQHITTNDKMQLDNRHLYVSTNEADNKNYAGVYATIRMANNIKQKVFSMKFEATEDLISPSKKERIENFLNLYFSDPKRVSKDMAIYQAALRGQSAKKYYKQYMNMSLDELSTLGYDDFAMSWARSSKTRESYFNILKSKGYNALIDDNDINTGIPQAISPLIVFNAKEKLAKVSVTELTKAQMMTNIEDWTNMAHSAFA